MATLAQTGLEYSLFIRERQVYMYAQLSMLTFLS